MSTNPTSPRYGIEPRENVLETSEYRLWRGTRSEDAVPVLVKEPVRSGGRGASRLAHEYDVLRSVRTTGVPEALGLSRVGDSSALIMRDGHPLRPLSAVLRTGAQDVGFVLRLALQLSETLGRIHRQGIVHAGITPTAVLLTDEDEALLVDFSRSSLLSMERQEVKSGSTAVTSGLDLRYGAPEQTGRMNRAVDWRTDMYSLGVVLYEALTGRLPFASADAMELMHAHIAVKAVPPSAVRSDIPLTLSEIVVKLLNKTAEERYQSGFGLKRDIAECVRQWESTGTIEVFPVGALDVSDRFQLPQKLYGREADVQRLLEVFAEAESGRGRLLLVKGASGIGKSSLVQEVQKPIVRTRGYFVQGKFDQFKRDIPYSALSAAFGGLMRQIAAETEAGVAWWRERFQAAMGTIGGVITEIVPQFEAIAGKQPALPELGPNETQNRFKLAMERFVRACSSAEHPLVMFIDDLQWADAASLEVLKVLTDAESRHVLLIGAYRDNEVDGSHPLTKTLDVIRSEGGIVDEVLVSALSAGQVRELVSDAVGRNDEETWKLSLAVHEKTAGNPFFVGEVLMTLYREGIVRFNEEVLRWDWSMEEVQRVKLAGTVVELMVSRLQTLPEAVREVVRLAACVGNEFRLGTLAVVAEQSVEAVAGLLWEAAKLGFVVPVGEGYKYVRRGSLPDGVSGQDEYRFVHDAAQEAAYDAIAYTTAEEEQINPDEVGYQFAHDRVQQAAYGLIEANKRAEIHLKIGRLLLQDAQEEELDEKVFEIVRHLNEGRQYITEAGEKRRVAELNTRACKRAKSARAYEAAVRYAEAAVATLGAFGWQGFYAQTLAAYNEGAEAWYLATDYEKMEAWCDEVERNAKDVLDAVFAAEVLIVGLMSAGKKESVEVGVRILRELGEGSFDATGKLVRLNALKYVLWVRLLLVFKGVPDAERAAPLTDPKRMAIMRIFAKITTPILFFAPDAVPIVVSLGLLNLWKYGYSDEAAFVANVYTMLSTEVFQDIGLSKKLLDRISSWGFSNPGIEARNSVGEISFANFWFKPVLWLQQYTESLVEKCLDAGDMEYAAYAKIHGSLQYPLLFGIESLEKTTFSADETFSFTSKYAQVNMAYYTGCYKRAIYFMGRPHADREFYHFYDGTKEEAMLLALRERNDIMGLYLLPSVKLFFSCFLGTYSENVSSLAEYKKHKKAALGIFFEKPYMFYHAYFLLGVYFDASISLKERKSYLRLAQKSLSSARRYAKWAPFNFAHFRSLLEAEYCAVRGKNTEAEVWYDRAVEEARTNGSMSIEGLACARAAAHYLRQGRQSMAGMYLAASVEAYRRWGAEGVIASLHERYGDILGAYQAPGWSSSGSEEGQLQNTEHTTESASSDTSSDTSIASVDIEALSRASQAIAGEIELESLLKKVMTVTLQSAGASAASLALLTENRLNIVAESTKEGVVVLAKALAAETATHVPGGVLSQTARLGEVRIVGDVAQDEDLQKDAGLRSRGVKSLLCQPVLNQGKLVGVLYVENNVTTEAFTPERTRVLSLLASQAAVSIENALLVANMTKMERLKREMEMAAGIQLGMLPKTLPVIAGYESGAMLRMTREAGGDLYDIVPMNAKEYLLVVGDVSGKGMPAALYMSAALNILRTEIACFAEESAEISPARLLKIVNKLMKGTMQPGNFITLFVGILNVETHELRYSSGGHDPCAKYHPVTGAWELLNTEGQACGAVGAKMYDQYVEEKRVAIAPGDYLVWNTDGITEAKDVEDAEYTDGRLWSRVKEIRGTEHPDAVIGHIVKDVELFAGAAEQYDDMTLLCVRRVG